jgi:predicted nucleic acid-binding protein
MLFDTRYFWTLFTSKDKAMIDGLRRIFERSESPTASSITIYEVSKLSMAAEGKDVADLRCRTIEGEFDIVDVDSGVAELGAEISHRLKVPMADALIMATAKRLRLPCVTDDTHFSEVKTVWV